MIPFVGSWDTTVRLDPVDTVIELTALRVHGQEPDTAQMGLHLDPTTMLITGEEDYRTPMSETEQLYQALTLKGVDVVMVRVPGSPHGIAGKPSRLVAKVDNILAWFARYRSDLQDAESD